MSELSDVLRAWQNHVLLQSAPVLAEVQRRGAEVPDGSMEVTLDGDSATVPAAGSADYQDGDLIYVQRTPYGAYPIAYGSNGADGTLYPRMRADYLGSPGGTLYITASTGVEFTIGDSQVILDETDPRIIIDGNTYYLTGDSTDTRARKLIAIGW